MLEAPDPRAPRQIAPTILRQIILKFTGYDDQMFRVNGYATRAQVAKVIFLAEKLPAELSK